MSIPLTYTHNAQSTHPPNLILPLPKTLTHKVTFTIWFSCLAALIVGILLSDNMLIPKGGDAYTASVFMNYVYDAKVAAQIEDYVNYVCPVKGADKVLLKTDPAVAKNPLVFPSAKTLAQLHQNDPKALFNVDYKTQWQKLLGA